MSDGERAQLKVRVGFLSFLGSAGQKYYLHDCHDYTFVQSNLFNLLQVFGQFIKSLANLSSSAFVYTFFLDYTFYKSTAQLVRGSPLKPSKKFICE